MIGKNLPALKEMLAPDIVKVEIVGLLAIIATTVLIYQEAFHGFFVQDDFGWLYESRFQNLRDYIQCFFRFSPAAAYRPLSQETFFFLGQKVFGMWPPGFHALSLGAHLTGIALVYLLLRKFSPVLASLIGTLFYAVHNAHLWSLYWISAFPEPLALVFFVTAILLFIRFDREGSRTAYFLSVVSMIMGMMSKESILTLPIVLAFYCVFFCPRRLLWAVPYFALSATYGVFRAMSTAVKAAPYALTFGYETFRNLGTYVAWAAGLNDTILIQKFGWESRNYPLVAVAFAGVVLLLVILSENKRVALFAAVWFLVVLQPVLYFSGHLFNYYLAPALVAVSLLLAQALRPVQRRWNRVRAVLGVGIVWLGLGTALANVRREGRWWNARTYLARDILSKMPEVDRQVPPEKTVYLFGFGEEEFGVLQNDAAFYLYGFAPPRFVLFGLNGATADRVRALKQSGGIHDYYCFVYSSWQFVNTSEEFRRNPELFLAPKRAPAMELEVNARELTRGRDSLILRVWNFEGPAIDLLYSVDGKPMPPILNWSLDEKGMAKVPVSESTAAGLYRFRAIRDSRNATPMGWAPVDVQVIVH